MTALADRGTAVHTPRVIVLSTVSVIVAFVVQTSVLPAVGLSAVIPLVFTTVAVLAVVLGARTGAKVGFAAGLLLDLTGSGVLGVGALIGCLLAAVCGRIAVDRWRWSGLISIWVYTCLAATAFTVANAVLTGRGLILTTAWLWIVVGAGVCSLVLLPLRAHIRAVVR